MAFSKLNATLCTQCPCWAWHMSPTLCPFGPGSPLMPFSPGMP